MIIIEGMDNSGKSRLAAHLAEKFGLRIIKRSGPPKDREAFILETLEFLILNPEVIYDRHPLISEEVYGPILRNVNVFNRPGVSWEDFLNSLLRLDPLIIYCRPPDEKILCFGDRDQMPAVVENARRLIDAYDRVMGWIRHEGTLFVVHDFTRLTADIPTEDAVAAYLKMRGGLKGYEYR